MTTEVKRTLKKIRKYDPNFKWNKQIYERIKKENEQLGIISTEIDELDIILGSYILPKVEKEFKKFEKKPLINENTNCDLEIKNNEI